MEEKVYRYKKSTGIFTLTSLTIIVIIPFILIYIVYLARGRGFDLIGAIPLFVLQIITGTFFIFYYMHIRKFQLKLFGDRLEINGILSKKIIRLEDINNYRFYSRGGMSGNLLLHLNTGKTVSIGEEIDGFDELFNYISERIICDRVFAYAFFRKGILAGVLFCLLFYVFVLVFPPKNFSDFIWGLSPIHIPTLYFFFILWKFSFSMSFTDTHLYLKRPFIKDIVFPWQDIKDRGKVDLKYERRFIWDIWACTITLDNKKIVFDKLIDNGEELLKIVAEKTNSPFLNA